MWEDAAPVAMADAAATAAIADALAAAGLHAGEAARLASRIKACGMSLADVDRMIVEHARRPRSYLHGGVVEACVRAEAIRSGADAGVACELSRRISRWAALYRAAASDERMRPFWARHQRALAISYGERLAEQARHVVTTDMAGRGVEDVFVPRLSGDEKDALKFWAWQYVVGRLIDPAGRPPVELRWYRIGGDGDVDQWIVRSAGRPETYDVVDERPGEMPKGAEARAVFGPRLRRYWWRPWDETLNVPRPGSGISHHWVKLADLFVAAESVF
jgi:hypothetical protein